MTIFQAHCTSDTDNNFKHLLLHNNGVILTTTPQGNPHGGLRRIINAGFYSAAGLKAATKYEPSFRQELILTLIILPVIAAFPMPMYLKWLLFFSHLMILVTELLNSSVEAVVDMVSPEYHELAKRAKDMGSAAVFVSFIPPLAMWCYVIYLASFTTGS